MNFILLFGYLVLTCLKLSQDAHCCCRRTNTGSIVNNNNPTFRGRLTVGQKKTRGVEMGGRTEGRRQKDYTNYVSTLNRSWRRRLWLAQKYLFDFCVGQKFGM